MAGRHAGKPHGLIQVRLRPRRASAWLNDEFGKLNMTFLRVKHVAAAALIGLASIGAASRAWANIEDYEFQLVRGELKKGEAVIAVRLVNKRTGQPVPDAVIFATRLDMGPEGMPEMATKLTPVPSAEPGVYQFKANLRMAGGWQLSLGAKVQGETGTLENKLEFKAVP